VYQQSQRWLKAKVFEALVHDLREVLRVAQGRAVELAYVDQGYTGAQAAEAHHMQLAVVKLPEAKQGGVWLPKRWVVERRHAWAARLRRLARDDEQLAEPLAGLHCVAFAILMLKRVMALIVSRA
jgi:transposase